MEYSKSHASQVEYKPRQVQLSESQAEPISNRAISAEPSVALSIILQAESGAVSATLRETRRKNDSFASAHPLILSNC